jgi:hydrogenase/urease accessory protein HupE
MRVTLALLWTAWVLVLACGSAAAHETRPGFLELREIGPGAYSYLWKKPTGGEVEIAIAPVLPPGCALTSGSNQPAAIGAIVLRGTLRCDGSLRGRTVEIAGLPSTITDVLLRVHHADGTLESHVLKPDTPLATLGAETSLAQRYASYLLLGFEHILQGVDHLLLVLGLMLIVADRWMLFKAVTAFTVAHSLTLALATLGHVSVPAAPLEASIALSILFLGPEIVRRWRGQTSLTIRQPWIVAFAFGLLHGFGFATGLAEIGLPRAEIPAALLFFNLGVEGGQLLFIAVLIALERASARMGVSFSPALRMLPGYIVGTLGAFWTFQRLAPLVLGAI